MYVVTIYCYTALECRSNLDHHGIQLFDLSLSVTYWFYCSQFDSTLSDEYFCGFLNQFIINRLLGLYWLMNDPHETLEFITLWRKYTYEPVNTNWYRKISAWFDGINEGIYSVCSNYSAVWFTFHRSLLRKYLQNPRIPWRKLFLIFPFFIDPHGI